MSRRTAATCIAAFVAALCAVVGAYATTTSVATVESIKVRSADSGDLALGGSRQYTATAYYVGGGTADVTASVTWSSSDTNVATIDSAGLASGLAPGETSIQATDGTVTSPAVPLVVSKCTIRGTDDGETITGTAGIDVICGRGGKDTINGLDGADILIGGPGEDTIHGGPGADTLSGGEDSDTLNGDGDNDVIKGGTEGDTLDGGADDDRLHGQEGDDSLAGGTGDDRMNPGAGSDPSSDGGDGVDTLLYHTAASAVDVSLADGVATGGAGADAGIVNVENLTGSSFADSLEGDGGVNMIDGGQGADTIRGLANDDRLLGNDGSDTIEGGGDHDYLAGQDGDDTLSGGPGNDRLGGHADVDVLDGGDDDDELDPGLGDETSVDGGTGTDELTYHKDVPAVTIDIDAGTSTGGGGNDAFTNIENASGTKGDDTLLGDENANFLDGKPGSDTIDGRAGTDVIEGGFGDDFLRGGADIDSIDGQGDTDTCGEPADTLVNCELAFNVAPSLTIGDATNTFTEGDPSVAVDGTLTLTDDEANTDGATVTIGTGFESGKDILSISGALPAGVTASYTTPTLTISGTATVAQYETMLRNVRFENTSQDPSPATRTISFTVSDGELADDTGNDVAMDVLPVNDAPIADADSFGGGQQGLRMRVGTVHADTHEVEVAGDVLDGDVDVDTPAGNLTVTPGALTSTDCAVVCPGNVTMAADGTFTYDPPAGDDGSDTFTYTVEDNDTGDSDGTEDTHSNTVTITQAGPRVWFVDDSAPAGGRGTSHFPLQALTPLATGGSLDAQDGSGDRIFVYSGTYASGIELEATQKLLGEPEGLNVNSTQFVVAGGTKPAISSGSGNAVTLGSGNELQDLALGSTPAASYSLSAPTGSGSFTVGDSDITNATGGALNVADGTPTMALGTLSSSNSANDAVRITDTDGGAISSTSGTLANAGGTSVHVANAASSLALGSNITDDLGSLITISGGTGANTFNGTVTDGVDGDGSGISISSAGGAVNFTNAVTLSTGSANALSATSSSGGLRMVPSSGVNTLATTDGAALTVTNTPIHQDGLAFRSINANDGSIGATTYGIQLENTGTGGTNGSVTVAGNGAASTGGTITGKSTGIRLVNTKSPSINWMKLHNHGDFAIYGNSVSGFAMDRTVIDGQGGTFNGDDPNADEGAVSFDNLTGTGAAITNSTIAQGIENDLRVVNTSGTLNRLTVTNTTFSNTSSVGNHAVMLEGLNSAVLNATVQDSTFTSVRGNHVNYTAQNSSAGDVVIANNTMSNSHPTDLGGQINVAAGQTADLTYAVNGNTISGSKASAIFAGKLFGAAPGDATMVGTIQNNIIGLNGVPASGSESGSGIDAGLLAKGKHSVVISGNTVRQYRDNGILLTVGGAATSSTGLASHDGDMNYTVTGNTVTQPSGVAGAGAGGGIHLNSGTNSPDAYDVCLNLQNNTLSGSAPAAVGSRDVVLRQRFDTVVRMPGYTGAQDNAGGTLTTDITNYLIGRGNTFNAGSLLASANSASVPGGFFNTAGGAPCPTT